MPGRLLSVSILVGMCEFSCDRDFESCFTTIPEIRAQLLMAAEPNICEGRLIPLTGGSWLVAVLDGPHGSDILSFGVSLKVLEIV